MAVLEEFEIAGLKPGRYAVGGGRFRDLPASEIADYVAGSKAVLEAGHGIPLLYEHAEPGSSDGAPVVFSGRTREGRANIVKHGAGWLSGVRQAEDGAAVFRVKALPEVAKQIRAGVHKWVSPELRRKWEAGDGRGFEKFFSHVALTHRPRNIEQGDFDPVQMSAAGVEQFSLAEWEMAKTEEDDPSTAVADPEAAVADAVDPDPIEDAEEVNPDMPTEDETSEEKQIEALVATFKECFGIDLPADTDRSTIIRDLLTAAKTWKAATDKHEMKEEEPDLDDEAGVEEQQAPMQFSLAAVEAGKVKDKALGRLIKLEHGGVKARLDLLVEKTNISPALRNGLLGNESILQFSAEGDHLPAFTLPQVVELLEATTQPGMAAELTEDQLSAAGITAPNAPVEAGGAVDEAEAKRLADEFQAKHPGLFKPTKK